MNKNAIQKFAIWARNELIDQVKQRAFQYGISDKGHGEEQEQPVTAFLPELEKKQPRSQMCHGDGAGQETIHTMSLFPRYSRRMCSFGVPDQSVEQKGKTYQGRQ